MPRPASTRITAPYGYSAGYDGFHNGIDFAHDDPEATPVFAFQSGRVTFVGFYPGWAGRGRVVVIDHGNGVVSWSCHLASATVVAGQNVTVGQRVGLMGATGAAQGIHLHWMIYLNGKVVDPTPYLAGSSGGGTSPFPGPKDNEAVPHIWKYMSADPRPYIIIDHLNMTYRIIPAGSLEAGAIDNDIAAGFARYDEIADPEWGQLFGNGQFRQITKPDPVPSGGGSGGGATPAQVETIVQASEKRVIGAIPTSFKAV